MNVNHTTSAFVLFLLINSLIINSSSYAARYTSWEDQLLYGGQVTSLAVSPIESDVIYAGTWQGDGLYKSTDGGEQWYALPSRDNPWFKNIAVYDIEIDHYDAQIIWVANADYVDVSFDGGSTWESIPVGSHEGRLCYCIAIDVHDHQGNTLFCGTGGKNFTNNHGVIYKTVNKGADWFPVLTTEYNAVDIKVHPLNRDEIWFVGNQYQLTPHGQIGRSVDGGVTWQTWDFDWYVDEIIIGSGPEAAIIACGDRGIIRYAAEAAYLESWQHISQQSYCSSVALSAFDSQTVYAAFLDSLGVSHDSGASWEYFSSPGELLTLTLQPGKIDRLIGGHVNRGIVTISTTDLQWQYQNNGLNANAVLEIAHSSDNENWDYAATYGGLYLRSSREQVWDLINPRPAEAVSVRSGENAAVFVGFDQAIGKSSDGGVSWDYIDISHDEKPWGVSSLATSLAQPEIVYAGLYNYIDLKGLVLKSNNSGDSYEVILDTATPVNCVHIAQSDPNTLYVGTGSFYSPVMPGSLFKSNDNGMTWTQQNTQLSVINSIIADSKNADHIYAACGAYDYSFSGILHSIDSGSSWVRLNNGLPFKKQLFAGLSSSDFAATTLCLDPSVPEHLYCALYDQGVYFSPNSGNYWTRIGLSEYVLNTLTSSAGSDTTSVGSHVARSAASESILLNAGTDSGMYQYRLAGNGIVTGTVRSSITGDFLDKAEINTDSGAACLSSQGYYVLLLPAGAHTLQTILNGYENNAVDHISIAAGETLSHDIFLQPAGNTINKTPCLLSGFGETEKNHELFSCVRALRDSALAKHAIGVIMIKWYYQVSALLSGSVK